MKPGMANVWGLSFLAVEKARVLAINAALVNVGFLLWWGLWISA
jgi:hypothetical protein